MLNYSRKLAAVREILAQDAEEFGEEICIAVENMAEDVQTRSGWAGAGETWSPADFRMSLGDGVTVVGTLGKDARPVTATIEGFQHITTEDTAMLVRFCDYLQYHI
ncbi:hypothetical protein GOD54_23485 [Sinorhizobium medicae]|nr:hypothetical protein [Sinorhizobium medicae]